MLGQTSCLSERRASPKKVRSCPTYGVARSMLPLRTSCLSEKGKKLPNLWSGSQYVQQKCIQVAASLGEWKTDWVLTLGAEHTKWQIYLSLQYQVLLFSLVMLQLGL